MNTARKRKLGSADSAPAKRLKVTETPGPSRAVDSDMAVASKPDETDDHTNINQALGAQHKGKESGTSNSSTNKSISVSERAKRRRINKLVPPRPFPSVPTSVAATGPRSAHKEGKNYICLTRKTTLGAYMRRCKDVIIKDGYKTLYLSAMGAAIPHLLQLSLALPPILPFALNDIHTEVTTGTVEVQDEIIPEDEDEDITYQTRGKSTLSIVFKIGDGVFGGDNNGPIKRNGRNRGGNNGARPGRAKGATERQEKEKMPQSETYDVVLQEPEQEMI